MRELGGEFGTVTGPRAPLRLARPRRPALRGAAERDHLDRADQARRARRLRPSCRCAPPTSCGTGADRRVPGAPERLPRRPPGVRGAGRLGRRARTATSSPTRRAATSSSSRSCSTSRCRGSEPAPSASRCSSASDEHGSVLPPCRLGPGPSCSRAVGATPRPMNYDARATRDCLEDRPEYAGSLPVDARTRSYANRHVRVRHPSLPRGAVRRDVRSRRDRGNRAGRPLLRWAAGRDAQSAANAGPVLLSGRKERARQAYRARIAPPGPTNQQAAESESSRATENVRNQSKRRDPLGPAGRAATAAGRSSEVVSEADDPSSASVQCGLCATSHAWPSGSANAPE